MLKGLQKALGKNHTYAAALDTIPSAFGGCSRSRSIAEPSTKLLRAARRCRSGAEQLYPLDSCKVVVVAAPGVSPIDTLDSALRVLQVNVRACSEQSIHFVRVYCMQEAVKTLLGGTDALPPVWFVTQSTQSVNIENIKVVT
eukprot:1903859-Amphidinium_carterae.2